MRRFAFRFQGVLDLKKSMEEARKIALGEVIAALNREHELLARMRRNWQQYRQAGNRLPKSRLCPPLLGLNASYLQRLEQEMDEQLEHIRRIEAMVEDQRQKLVEAARERRVFEILKEKAWKAHQHEMKRQERIQLDEVGEQLFARRRNEGAELNQ